MSIRYRSLLLFLPLLLGALARPGAAQSMAPVLDAANGHWYQAVRVAGAITWDDAKAAAQSLTFSGYPGHLVAITSAAENQFIVSQILPLAPDVQLWWLGGYQDGSAADYVEPAGGWRWVTGEPWSYTSWYPGEPNNYGGNEDAIEYHQAKGWNDYPRGSGLGGYIVEYEPVPIDTGPLLAIQPNPVVGGQSATGTITLAQPAGLGGVVVSLTSSDPTAAVVPASLTIPTGANSFTFPITTFAVSSPAAVTISAGGVSGTVTATLQVVPPPAPPAPTAPPAAGPSLPPGQQAAAPPVYNPANGHWYLAVTVPGGLSWYQAEGFAAALTDAGFAGHLVTITSDAEQQFVASHLPVTQQLYWWAGAYQDKSAPDYREPGGGWRWVTGEAFGPYTHWYPGQPDNDGSGEDALEFDAKLGNWWNDFPGTGTGVYGYLVEFEPPAPSPGPPTPSTASSAPLVLFPNPVPGGLLALGQVSLAQPAGPGGVVVSLTSSNPTAAVVPASAVIPSGGVTLTFPIVTFPVVAATSVTVSAGSAAGSATATLQVLPLSAPPVPSAANLLVNGSFEQPPGGDRFGVSDGVPGWRIVRGDIDIVTSSYWQVAPGGGNQSIDLDGFHTGTIEQSFPTVPGQEYLFSGSVSHNPSVPYGRANVSLNGVFFTQLAHAIPNTNPAMQWQPFSYRFRATAATTTLTLSDVTGINTTQGTVLDGLSVTLAPDQNPPAAPATTTAVTPTAPTALSAQALASTQVALFWRDTSNNETAFAIWRRDRAHDWAQVGVAAPNATTYADSGLIPGTVYNYRVQAINGTAASDWSNTVTVRTSGG